MKISIRTFLLAILALGPSLFAAEPASPEQGRGVTLNWLDGTPPAIGANVTWGVPWPKGAVQPGTKLELTDAAGKRVDVQSWPLAYWPDGSLKWTGHAITAPAGLAGPFKMTPATRAADERSAGVAIQCTDSANELTIDTGAVKARIAKQGDNFFESLIIGSRTVATNGHLTAIREDRSEQANGVLRQQTFTSHVHKVTLEQSGPGRAVVKVEGRHAGNGLREWLPFTVRLYFFAGSADIRLVHTFVFDGDPEKDFLKGLGLTFNVPFKEERQNRHIRLAGDEGGFWNQPVQMLPGYRAQAGNQIGELYADHLAGHRVPNLAELTPQARNAAVGVALWPDAKLTQTGPNSWSMFKRTGADASWLHYTDGHRASGLVVLGDVSGGLAVGVKDFWQKHPAALEALNGDKDVGEICVWLWSPDAPAMDLRR
jgi:hypothetical protein